MTDKLRVLIVDDEPLALEYMERLLGDVEVLRLWLAAAREALAEQHQAVDLIFLDIQMPGLNGLDVVKRCQSDVMPAVVLQLLTTNMRCGLLKPMLLIISSNHSMERVEALSRAKDRLLSVALQSGKEAAVGDCELEAVRNCLQEMCRNDPQDS